MDRRTHGRVTYIIMTCSIVIRDARAQTAAALAAAATPVYRVCIILFHIIIILGIYYYTVIYDGHSRQSGGRFE